jgi:hypothetical protein
MFAPRGFPDLSAARERQLTLFNVPFGESCI